MPATGRYIFQLHSGDLPSRKFSEYYRRDVARAFQHTGNYELADLFTSIGDLGEEAPTMNAPIGGTTQTLPNGGFVSYPAAKGFRGDTPDPNNVVEVNVAGLQGWLLRLGADPTGLVSSRTNEPDGIYGRRTGDALVAMAGQFQQDNILVKVPTKNARTIYVSPPSIIARIKDEASKVDRRTAALKKSYPKLEIIKASNLPTTQPDTVGRLAVMTVRIINQASDYANRIDRLPDSYVTEELRSVYNDWFMAATGVQRVFATRLQSPALSSSLAKAAGSEGYASDDVIYSLGRRRMSVAHIMSVAPNLGPLPKFNEGLGILQYIVVIVAALIAMTAIVIAGASATKVVYEEKRRMQASTDAKTRLDKVLDAIEKKIISAEQGTAIAKTTEPVEPPPPADKPWFGFTVPWWVWALGGAVVVYNVTRRPESGPTFVMPQALQQRQPALAGVISRYRGSR